jgi:hypothetical protein
VITPKADDSLEVRLHPVHDAWNTQGTNRIVKDNVAAFAKKHDWHVSFSYSAILP